MTDFFTHLAEQTLGRAPVAAPLVAPRFAPTTVEREPAASWLVVDEELTPPTIAETRQASPPPSIPPHQAEPPTVEAGSVVPPPMLVPMPPAGAYAPAHAELPAERPRPTASLADEPAQAGEPASGAVPEKARAAEETQPAPARPTIERVPVTIQSRAPKTTIQSPERPTPAFPVDVPLLVAPESAPTQATYPPPAEPPPPTPKAETVQETPPIQHTIEVETHVIPPIKNPPPPQPSVTRQARRPAAESGHQAPAIRVTIGRVEVRAVQPPEPPRPRPRPAMRMPALSLDDYLRQRNGGQP